MKAKLVTSLKKVRGTKGFEATASIGSDEVAVSLMVSTSRKSIANEMQDKIEALFQDWTRVENEIIKHAKLVLVETRYMPKSRSITPEELGIRHVLVSADEEFGDGFSLFAEVPTYLPEHLHVVYSSNFEFSDQNAELGSVD